MIALKTRAIISLLRVIIRSQQSGGFPSSLQPNTPFLERSSIAIYLSKRNHNLSLVKVILIYFNIMPIEHNNDVYTYLGGSSKIVFY